MLTNQIDRFYNILQQPTVCVHIAVAWISMWTVAGVDFEERSNLDASLTMVHKIFLFICREKALEYKIYMKVKKEMIEIAFACRKIELHLYIFLAYVWSGQYVILNAISCWHSAVLGIWFLSLKKPSIRAVFSFFLSYGSTFISFLPHASFHLHSVIDIYVRWNWIEQHCYIQKNSKIKRPKPNTEIEMELWRKRRTHKTFAA